MQNYPLLKTSIPFLQLQPLAKKHLPFLVELLSLKDIQRLLFRIPTNVTIEKQAKSLEKMYTEDKPKEITYILTVKKLFSEKFVGYVKIKLIDWEVMSCYLSVALLPDTEYRGKGFAKAAYDSFFTYLFSLGFMKIYGRTYETNIPTIKLNFATGFRFIGRQTDFILYPNSTSLDALFFEKLNPILKNEFRKPFTETLAIFEEILKPLHIARENSNVTKSTLEQAISSLSALKGKSLPTPLQIFSDEVIESLKEEASQVTNSSLILEPKLEGIRTVLRESREQNATNTGYGLLAKPVTVEQLHAELELVKQFAGLLDKAAEYTDIPAVDIENALWYGAYTQANWKYLYPLFLGLQQKNNGIKTILEILKTSKAKATL